LGASLCRERGIENWRLKSLWRSFNSFLNTTIFPELIGTKD